MKLTEEKFKEIEKIWNLIENLNDNENINSLKNTLDDNKGNMHYLKLIV